MTPKINNKNHLNPLKQILQELTSFINLIKNFFFVSLN